MNTERDNFHDWARDKADTSFDTIPRPELDTTPDHRTVRWGRLVLLALLAVAVMVGFKKLAGL